MCNVILNIRYRQSFQVTIYHWDLPNILEELGGWTNPNIIDYFKDYATFVFDTFGDKVSVFMFYF